MVMMRAETSRVPMVIIGGRVELQWISSSPVIVVFRFCRVRVILALIGSLMGREFYRLRGIISLGSLARKIINRENE